jgi:cytochrome bd-type quinol oxidase subunit 1
MAAAPLGYAAVETGWLVREVGREGSRDSKVRGKR